MEEKIISRIRTLGIKELTSVEHLEELNGDYINLESILPHGNARKMGVTKALSV